MRLAADGELLIEWAADHMPVLGLIRNRFIQEKPLEGTKIGACLHATKETAVLIRTLEAGGADVALCGSNPLSTHDSVVAALAATGTKVYAWREQTTDEYYWCVNKVIDSSPIITLDDGADLVSTLHKSRIDKLKGVKGGSEETTTGVNRLRAMHKDNALKYPIIAVNDTKTKSMFDNRYGTGQSTIDGLLRASSIMLAGKNFVVCGYGWCGKGVASRARGMGSHVIVTEINPIRALEATMDGFQVMPLEKAASVGDIFVTVTGNTKVIDEQHIKLMKDGVLLANSGHFNVEVNILAIESLSKSKRRIRPDLDEYKMKNGYKLYLAGEGRLVNLAAAEGHPSEVMDMSFSDQTFVVEYLWKNDRLENGVHDVPPEIDEMVASLKLKGLGIEIDRLTEEQKKYLTSWGEGTT